MCSSEPFDEDGVWVSRWSGRAAKEQGDQEWLHSESTNKRKLKSAMRSWATNWQESKETDNQQIMTLNVAPLKGTTFIPWANYVWQFLRLSMSTALTRFDFARRMHPLRFGHFSYLVWARNTQSADDFHLHHRNELETGERICCKWQQDTRETNNECNTICACVHSASGWMRKGEGWNKVKRKLNVASLNPSHSFGSRARRLIISIGKQAWQCKWRATLKTRLFHSASIHLTHWLCIVPQLLRLCS